jgi:D-arabinose 1-dehydrogenase-like Zn-dependent alcohol dehydrogenase
MCAGITTFNALRSSGARAGDLVAVLGIGGLGHLAVQFAAKMGFKTVAIARGKDKEPLAKKLGAYRYINSESEKVADVLLQMGGAKVILSTITNTQALQETMAGLGLNGKVVIVGASPEPIQVSPQFLIRGKRSVAGWASGSSIDSEETMSFCALTGIRSMNEVFPLEQAAKAFDLMMHGKVRFRAILTME